MTRWWRQPDHYDWIVTYMQGHGLITVTRVMLVGVTVSMAAVPAILAASGEGPCTATCVNISYLGSFVGVCSAMLWALGAPTRRGSIAYAALCSVSIATASLCQTDPLIGLSACTAFTCVAGYVAFFHDAWQMLCNFTMTILAAGVSAVGLAADHRGVLALGVLWLVIVINVAVPFGIQIVVHTLGVDLLQADRDPLTGLLNRRGFERKVRELTAAHADGAHLVVLMIDLDSFKVLNDTHGHAAGDHALVHVAGALRSTARTEAVVGRAGGEEFLIADVVSVPEPVVLAETLREAIALGPHPITASIGSASTPLCLLNDANVETAIVQLTVAADLAMYEAKRAGGNQIRYAEVGTGLRT